MKNIQKSLLLFSVIAVGSLQAETVFVRESKIQNQNIEEIGRRFNEEHQKFQIESDNIQKQMSEEQQKLSLTKGLQDDPIAQEELKAKFQSKSNKCRLAFAKKQQALNKDTKELRQKTCEALELEDATIGAIQFVNPSQEDSFHICQKQDYTKAFSNKWQEVSEKLENKKARMAQSDAKKDKSLTLLASNEKDAEKDSNSATTKNKKLAA